jgi:hypothetical protein
MELCKGRDTQLGTWTTICLFVREVLDNGTGVEVDSNEGC